VLFLNPPPPTQLLCLPFYQVYLTCDWWWLSGLVDLFLNWLLRCCFTGPLVPLPHKRIQNQYIFNDYARLWGTYKYLWSVKRSAAVASAQLPSA